MENTNKNINTTNIIDYNEVNSKFTELMKDDLLFEVYSPVNTELNKCFFYKIIMHS